MPLETDTITLPDFWACALINGDKSGMEDNEIAHMDAYLKTALAGGWYVVDLVRDDNGEPHDPRFTWSYDLYGGTAKGGSVLDYVIHRQTPESAMTDRYHVQLYVGEGVNRVWRRVHPVGGDPYVFTKDEAKQYIAAQTIGTIYGAENYRLEKLPD